MLETIFGKRLSGWARMALIPAALCCLGAGWATSWDAIAKTADGVTSIQAVFVQEKHLEILSRPLISRGRFFFRKPASLRWEYTAPLQSLLVAHGGRTRQYVYKDGEMLEVSAAPARVMPVVMAEITRWLGGRFSESTDFKAELVPREKIILVPAAPALAGVIQRIELAFHDTPGVIRSVKIFESEASFTVFEFNDPRLNANVPDEMFQGP